MFEKKKLIMNCDVCDTRKIKEEDYSQYESILLNTDIMIVSAESKSILSRLPIVNNTDTILELPSDEKINMKSVNGSYEITGTTVVSENTMLTVNGSLIINPGTEDVLKNYARIIVNGSVKYPESLESYLNNMMVNGATSSYPDDSTVLKSTFEIDKYFPIRAREGAKYYVDSKVILTDKDVDVKKLAEKNVQFITKKFIVRESKLEESVPLFDEQVEFVVIPDDMAFVNDDVELDEAVVNKYGTRLYIYGDLDITDESVPVLEKIEKLVVKGEVSFLSRNLEAFKAVDAEYDELNVQKGRHFENSVSVTVDNSILEHSPEGIQIENTATVKIAEDVSVESILEKLHIENCANVFCSDNQISAVQAVCENVAHVGSAEDKDNPMGDIFGMLKNAMNTKIVNADEYVM